MKQKALEYLRGLGEKFLTEAILPEEWVTETLRAVSKGEEPDNAVDAAFFLVMGQVEFQAAQIVGMQDAAKTVQGQIRNVIGRLRTLPPTLGQDRLMKHIDMAVKQLGG